MAKNFGISPQIIANLLVRKGDNTDFRRLDDVVCEQIQEDFAGLSEEATWEWIESHIKDVANELYNKKSTANEDCTPLNFEIESYAEDYYIKFQKTPETGLLRQLHKLGAGHFESFCRDILKKLGGKAEMCGGSTDGGIDFYATNLSLMGLPELSTWGSRVLVIGQAKCYKNDNDVVLNELRHFIGSSIRKVDELRVKGNDKLGIMHPVVLAFWTTSDFHLEAKKYAQDMGIWYLNGLSLCKLATGLGIDITQQY